jgi:hypothetical protein
MRKTKLVFGDTSKKIIGPACTADGCVCIISMECNRSAALASTQDYYYSNTFKAWLI